jgi:hypothetical protein
LHLFAQTRKRLVQCFSTESSTSEIYGGVSEKQFYLKYRRNFDMRAAGITLISLALTTAVIGNAYYQKKQFYPSVVYITKSNPSMAVGTVSFDILLFRKTYCVVDGTV